MLGLDIISMQVFSFQNQFSQLVEFTTLTTGDKWILTNIYAPCTPDGRLEFLNWFGNVNMLDETDWIVLGDFNLIRYPENRNKLWGDTNLMLSFNEAISNLGLTELPLQEQRYTWSNKQENPLLERLDWVFTSPSWAIKYPCTSVSTMVRDTSDHVPCLVTVKINVPKVKIFRFENYWLEHRDFPQVMQHAWAIPPTHTDAAKRISAKLKTARRILKEWSKLLPNLSKIIANTKEVISLNDVIEESRDLTL